MDEAQRSKYIELQRIDAQVRKIQENLSVLEQEEAQLGMLIDNLSEIKDAKEGDEIMLPFANGVFFKGKLSEPKKMLVNVGAGTLVPKTPDEVKAMLFTQQKSIGEYKKALINALESLYSEAESLEKEIGEIA